MMDSRAHGESGGEMATYGWKERYDTVAITDALYATENVRHLYALGVSMGAAIALQSAAVEPRIAAVAAEDPFANLREVSYDYAGLDVSPLLGKTLFRPATIFALDAMKRAGGFNPDEVSPEKAVAQRPFPVLLICGTTITEFPAATRKQSTSRDRTQRIVDRARSRPRLSPRASPGGIRKSRNQFLQKISSKLTRSSWFAICSMRAPRCSTVGAA